MPSIDVKDFGLSSRWLVELSFSVSLVTSMILGNLSDKYSPPVERTFL